MCFILCCCCNCCNNFSSKCIEISILILSIIAFSSSIIGLLCVNEKHASKEGFACLIIVIIFSNLLIISIINILIWRFREVINNKRNSMGSYFSLAGLVITIFMLLFTGIWENMSISNFYSINHPCQSIKRSEVEKLLRMRILLTYEENKEEFCIENPDYFIDIVSTAEYIYLFASATILEIILLVLLYFWYNDYRRIKYLVDGPLVDSNTKENKIKYNNKASKFNNNNNNNIVYGQNDYVIHYDIFGKPILNTRKSPNKEVNDKKKIFNSIIQYSKNKNERKNRNSIVGVDIRNREKNRNREKVFYENKNNNNSNSINIYSSDRMNIYNLKPQNISVGKKEDDSNMDVSNNSSKTKVNDNNSINNDKSSVT